MLWNTHVTAWAYRFSLQNVLLWIFKYPVHASVVLHTNILRQKISLLNCLQEAEPVKPLRLTCDVWVVFWWHHARGITASEDVYWTLNLGSSFLHSTWKWRLFLSLPCKEHLPLLFSRPWFALTVPLPPLHARVLSSFSCLRPALRFPGRTSSKWLQSKNMINKWCGGTGEKSFASHRPPAVGGGFEKSSRRVTGQSTMSRDP